MDEIKRVFKRVVWFLMIIKGSILIIIGFIYQSFILDIKCGRELANNFETWFTNFEKEN